eukprot:m.2853 g.2853  ORF g.2853 m.2853 type:complete len:401 (-) comp2601_c0_seq2:65-1267(-)
MGGFTLVLLLGLSVFSCDPGEFFSQDTCEPCPGGSTQPQTNHSLPDCVDIITECAFGFVVFEIGNATTQTLCVPLIPSCSSGFFMVAHKDNNIQGGGAGCVPCPIGTYIAESRHTKPACIQQIVCASDLVLMRNSSSTKGECVDPLDLLTTTTTYSTTTTKKPSPTTTTAKSITTSSMSLVTSESEDTSNSNGGGRSNVPLIVAVCLAVLAFIGCGAFFATKLRSKDSPNIQGSPVESIPFPASNNVYDETRNIQGALRAKHDYAVANDGPPRAPPRQRGSLGLEHDYVEPVVQQESKGTASQSPIVPPRLRSTGMEGTNEHDYLQPVTQSSQVPGEGRVTTKEDRFTPVAPPRFRQAYSDDGDYLQPVSDYLIPGETSNIEPNSNYLEPSSTTPNEADC